MNSGPLQQEQERKRIDPMIIFYLIVGIATIVVMVNRKIYADAQEREHRAYVASLNRQVELYQAAEKGDVVQVDALLKPLTLTAGDRERLLGKAAQEGRTGVVRLCLNRGWSASPLTLSMAVCYQHVDIVRLLLAQDIQLEMRKGPFPLLCMAAIRPNVEIVRMLLHAGADVNCRVTEVSQGKNAENLFGWSPLMLAARYGNAGVVRLLLKSGADVWYRTAEGQSALTLAERYKHDKIAALLRQAGATQ